MCVSCSVVSDSLWPTRLLWPWDSPGKNTRMGCHFLLQGIFPTQGSNPGLPHCSWTLPPKLYEAIKTLGKTTWYLAYRVPRTWVINNVMTEVNNEGHFLASTQTSKYFENPKKRGTDYKSVDIVGEIWWQVLDMLLHALRDLFKVQSEISYEKFQQSQFKRAYIETSLRVQWSRLSKTKQTKSKPQTKINKRAYMATYTYIYHQAKFIKS